MKICYVYCNKPEYVRNHIILKGLKENNIDIIDCSSKAKNIIIRNIIKILKFLKHKNKADIILVGFPGHIITPIIRLLTKKKIIFDSYMSMYDTLVLDKKKFKKDSISAKICKLLDIKSCKAADKILLDTNEHINYFINEFKIPKNKFQRVLIGANDSIFYPRPMKIKDLLGKSKLNKKFIVEFHGAFIPLQGIEYIIKAAKILEKQNILFKIIGDGQTFKQNYNLAKKLKLNNIIFEGHQQNIKIPNYIAECSVGLGIFGDTQKAKRVIPNKAYEIIAMKKPLITADTKAARELFIHKKDIYLCKISDEKSLAKAILDLKNNQKLRNKIAEQGYKIFKKYCTPQKLTLKIKEFI